MRDAGVPAFHEDEGVGDCAVGFIRGQKELGIRESLLAMLLGDDAGVVEEVKTRRNFLRIFGSIFVADRIDLLRYLVENVLLDMESEIILRFLRFKRAL